MRTHPWSRPPRRIALVGVIALLCLTAGCGKKDEPAPNASTGTTATTAVTGTSGTTRPGTTSAPTTTDSGAASSTTTGVTSTRPIPPDETTTTGGGIDTMPGADTQTKSGTATAAGQTQLTAVRVARHEGYDRVVFEFNKGLPAYEIAYVNPPILQDASGEEVTVDGTAFLKFRFEPASAADYDNNYELVYTGPDRVTGDTAVLKEVVMAGDFEAVLTWVAGIDGKQDFRVATLTGPDRVVVDVRNH